jgi:hypothetical protein
MRPRVPAALRVTMAGAALASGSILADISSVSAATCPIPGQILNPNAYAAARQTLSVYSNGVKGYIGYTNPTLCNLSGGPLAFSLEGITLCATGTCSNWVQAGWQKIQGRGTMPMALCEYGNSGVAHQYWFTISAAQHAFQWDYTGATWHCRIDGVDRLDGSAPNMTQGNYVNAQGETNSQNTQIGGNYPSKLGLSVLRWRQVSLWQNYNLTRFTPDYPYGSSLAAPDYLLNWTNAT